MARSLFSITQSSYVPNESLTFYDRSSGGIRLTDFAYSSSGYPGTQIPNGIIAIDPAGSALSVLGPEGYETVYAQKRSDGTRAALTGTESVSGGALNIVGESAGSLKVGTDTAQSGATVTSVIDARSDAAATGVAYFKHLPTAATSNHVLTAYQAGTSGTGSAVNLVSDNTAMSTVQVSGTETNRGTIKVTHRGQADGTDSSASALSVDLTIAGTAAQGIFVTGTNGATTGNLITLRNNSRDDFVVKGTGRVGVGIATGGTPAGMLEVQQYDASTKGISVKAFNASSLALVEGKNSSGTVVHQVTKDGDVYGAGNVHGQFHPVNHGIVAWAYDPITAINSTVLTAGTVYLVKVLPSLSTSVTSIYWHIATAGVSPTSSQSEVGLYNSSGTKLQSANVDSNVTTTGLQTTTISSQAVSQGSFYWVAFVFNAGTVPAVARTNGLTGNGGLINVGLSAANYRFATNGTSQTALPSSITPASASQGIPLWAAIG